MAGILILGGYGSTGRVLAHYLLSESDAGVVVAGRNLAKAQALAAQLNGAFEGNRASARRVDAADAASLREGLRGVGIVLVAAPTAQHTETVARAALEAAVDYLDVQFAPAKLAVLRSLAPEIERRRRCFVTEAGFHPGLPSAMVRYAATQLSRIDRAVTACYLSMGRRLVWSEAVDELMEAFRHYQGQVFKNGRWTRARSVQLRRVDFGGEIGRRTCFSMFFEELRALPDVYPSLEEVGFYISGTHWFLDWVIGSVVMLGLRLFPRRGVRPLGRLYWWGMRTFAKPPYEVRLKVEARGQRDGKPATVEATVSHPDGYVLTAVPVVACLLQLLDGSARRPGLWMMGHLVEPVRLFRDMERMGIAVGGLRPT